MSEAAFDVGPFRTRVVIQPHEDRVYCERTQVNERLILEANARKRDMLQRRDAGFRQALSIPAVSILDVWAKYPGLHDRDPEVRKRTIRKIQRDHPEWSTETKKPRYFRGI